MVMSERTGWKKGGEFEVIAKTGEILLIDTLKEIVTGTHPEIDPLIMRVKFPV
jgi:hypothetical protein